jgi:hypothetical protein
MNQDWREKSRKTAMKTHTLTVLGSLVLGSLLLAAIATTSQAEEPQLKMYRVGDLVSKQVFQQPATWGVTTPDEWRSEYRASVESLERLKTLLSALCENQPAAVGVHQETLSLIVRHTPEGHIEIASLLAQLREEQPPTIQIHFRGIDTKKLEEINGEAELEAMSFLNNPSMTPEQTQELFRIAGGISEEHTVMLRSGRRTRWDFPNVPATIVARLGVAGTIQCRIDNISNDAGEEIPFVITPFEIQPGHSKVVRLYSEGTESFWVATPAMVSTPTASASTAAPNARTAQVPLTR